MHITTKALVLRTTDYKESDKILTLFTQDQGKLAAAARGCQLLAWSEMVLYDYQGRWSVKESATQRLFQGVRDDVQRLALGCYFAEVAELLAVEGLPSPELLSLTLNSLHALDKMPEKPLPLVKSAFEWKAMALAGYEPLLEDGKVRGEGISLPLPPPALAALEHILHGDPRRLFSFQLGEEPLKQLAGASEAYLRTQLERGFSTLDYYKSLRFS